MLERSNSVHKKCPVLSTLDNPRNSSYPWNERQQHFINNQKLKYQVILGINLARHLLRDKASHLWEKQQFVGIGCVPHELIYTKVSKIVSDYPKPLTYLDKLSLEHIFGLRSSVFLICWQPVTVNSILITRWLCTVCRTASDTHFHFFTIFYCLSNALHSSIGQNVKSLVCPSGLRCPVRV